MTVSKLRREMSQIEHLEWRMFFAREEQREDVAAKMAKARGGRG